MITVEQLPSKGVKREQAILELGKDEANGELLLQLVEYRKGQVQNGCSEGFGAAGVCPCCPTVGPNWSRANGWAAHHVRYLL